MVVKKKKEFGTTDPDKSRPKKPAVTTPTKKDVMYALTPVHIALFKFML